MQHDVSTPRKHLADLPPEQRLNLRRPQINRETLNALLAQPPDFTSRGGSHEWHAKRVDLLRQAFDGESSLERRALAYALAIELRLVGRYEEVMSIFRCLPNEHRSLGLLEEAMRVAVRLGATEVKEIVLAGKAIFPESKELGDTFSRCLITSGYLAEALPWLVTRVRSETAGAVEVRAFINKALQKKDSALVYTVLALVHKNTLLRPDPATMKKIAQTLKHLPMGKPTLAKLRRLYNLHEDSKGAETQAPTSHLNKSKRTRNGQAQVALNALLEEAQVAVNRDPRTIHEAANKFLAAGNREKAAEVHRLLLKAAPSASAAHAALEDAVRWKDAALLGEFIASAESIPQFRLYQFLASPRHIRALLNFEPLPLALIENIWASSKNDEMVAAWQTVLVEIFRESDHPRGFALLRGLSSETRFINADLMETIATVSSIRTGAPTTIKEFLAISEKFGMAFAPRVVLPFLSIAAEVQDRELAANAFERVALFNKDERAAFLLPALALLSHANAYEAAREAFLQIRLHPFGLDRALISRAIIALSYRQQIEFAHDVFRWSIVEGVPPAPFAYRIFGQALGRNNAADLVPALIRLDRTDEMCACAAWAYRGAKRWQEGIEIIETYFNQVPLSAKPIVADLRFHSGQYRSAVEYCDSFLDTSPEGELRHFAKAVKLESLYSLDRAAAFNFAQTIGPLREGVNSNRIGRIMRKLNLPFEILTKGGSASVSDEERHSA